LFNVPEECLHRERLKKNSGLIKCSGCIIVEHDGCVANGGCDAAAISLRDKRILLIEVKSGRISQSDATDAVRQLNECFKIYGQKAGKFHIIPVFLKAGRKSLDDFALSVLRRSRISKIPIQIRKSGDDLSGL